MNTDYNFFIYIISLKNIGNLFFTANLLKDIRIDKLLTIIDRIKSLLFRSAHTLIIQWLFC
jgi:hypothetical protein